MWWVKWPYSFLFVCLQVPKASKEYKHMSPSDSLNVNYPIIESGEKPALCFALPAAQWVQGCSASCRMSYLMSTLPFVNVEPSWNPFLLLHASLTSAFTTCSCKIRRSCFNARISVLMSDCFLIKQEEKKNLSGLAKNTTAHWICDESAWLFYHIVSHDPLIFLCSQSKCNGLAAASPCSVN